MHGAQIDDAGAVGLNACCDYNIRIGKGAILANGSATQVDQVIPKNCFAEGVPATVKKEKLTEEDRQACFGLMPTARIRNAAARTEEGIRRKKGL